MKVLFFTTSSRYSGGAILCLIPLINKLKEKGVEPLVVLKSNGNTEKYLKENDIPYIVIRSYDCLFNRKQKFTVSDYIKWGIKSVVNFISEIKVYNLMKEEKIDVFHLNCVYNVFGIKAAKKLGIPVVLHIREFAELNEFTPKYINRKKAFATMSQVDRCIAVSECIKDEYSKWLDRDKITKIYDGIDLDDIEKGEYKAINSDKISLGMFGSVIPLKGHIDAIKAVKILKDKGYNIELNIYGTVDDICLKTLRNYIDANDLSNEVIFRAFTDNQNKAYDSVDIVLVCSRIESFGRVAVETMIKAKQFIGSDIPATNELLDNGKYGLLYKVGNEQELAEKIIYAIGHDMQDIIESAQNRAISLFNADINSEKVFDVFKQLINK